MTVRMENGIIHLTGDCASGEAEELLQHLLAAPTASIDWRMCDTAHSSVIQVLFAARRAMAGPPKAPFLRSVVEPALIRAGQRGNEAS